MREHAKTFRQIGQNCLSEASRVKCDKEDYIAGLDEIIADLEASRDAAQEELDNEEDDDGVFDEESYDDEGDE